MADHSPSSRVMNAVRARTFAALGHSGFRRYYLGQGVSLVGTWLQAAAVRWLVFDQTRSEYMLGVVEVASLMPGLLVGLVAGALADRIAPLRMIVLMECGQMVLAILLTLLVGFQVIAIWQMATILALTRICVTFELPSRQVFFYELVGPETLSNAIALNSGLFNATRVLGPALAGVCLATIGATGCFALNALSYVAAIAALLSIRLERRTKSRPHANFTLGEILGGLHYLRTDLRMIAFFLLVTFFGVVGMGYEAMVPAYTRKILRADVQGYSILLACAGVGATLGAIVVASLAKQRRKERWAIGGMILFATFLAGAAFSPHWMRSEAWGYLRLWVASACLLGMGFGSVMFYACCLTVIQLGVPDDLRGRIMGIWMIVYSGSVPLGALWTGRAAQSWGVATVMAFSAFSCAVAGLVVLASGVLRTRYPASQFVSHDVSEVTVSEPTARSDPPDS